MSDIAEPAAETASVGLTSGAGACLSPPGNRMATIASQNATLIKNRMSLSLSCGDCYFAAPVITLANAAEGDVLGRRRFLSRFETNLPKMFAKTAALF